MRLARIRQVIFPGLFSLGCLFLAATTASAAGVPISYSGRIVEATGQPISGEVTLRVQFYRTATGGTAIPVTLNDFSVNLVNGMFQISIELSDQDFQTVFNGTDPAWIEVTDLAHNRVYPRQIFSAVPYALKVPIDSDTLAWNSDGKLTLSAAPVDGKVLSSSGGQLQWIDASGGGDMFKSTYDAGGTAGVIDNAENAQALGGYGPDHFRNASNINAGTIGDAYIPASIARDSELPVIDATSVGAAGAVMGSDYANGKILVGTATPGTYVQIDNNAANWNTAFSWGDHAAAGYLDLSSLSATLPLLYSNTTGTFSMGAASSISDGYLDRDDFIVFYNKQDAITGTTDLTVNSVTANADIKLNDDDASAVITLKAKDTTTASYVLTLPDNDGDNGQLLKTDGDGNLSWISPGGGGDMYAATYDAGGTVGVVDNAENAAALGGNGPSFYRDASNINAGEIGDAYIPSTIARDSELPVIDATSVGAAGAVMDADYANGKILVGTATPGNYVQIDNNSANWNTAFGWGNHSIAGYMAAATYDAGGTAGVVDNAEALGGNGPSYYRDASNINAGEIGDAYIPSTIARDSELPVIDATSVGAAGAVMDGDYANGKILVGTATPGTYVQIDNNSTTWNTAYTDRLKWDGTVVGDGSAGAKSTARTSLGLDSMATQAASAVSITGGTIDGVTLSNPGFTNDGISGDKVHGGTISNFASIGIDDNADGLAMTIDANERIGIGTSSPSSALSFGYANSEITLATNDGADNNRMNISAGGTFSSTRGAGISLMGNEHTSKGYLQLMAGVPATPSLWSDGAILFNTNNTNQMVLDRTGKLGIGTTAPDATLDIFKTGGADLILRGHSYGQDTGGGTITGVNGQDDALGAIKILQQGSGPAGEAEGYIAFDVATNAALAEKMRITYDGSVGIGTSSPGAKLEVAGQVKITGGTPAAGKVLTTVDGSGLASWESIPAGNFSGIATGTNTTATMTVGAGSTIAAGGGVIESTVFKGSGSTTNAVDLATAEAAGTLPVSKGGTGVTTGSANLVFATPDGSSGAPGMRALTAADIPSLTAAKISDFATADTNAQSKCADGQFLRGEDGVAVCRTAAQIVSDGSGITSSTSAGGDLTGTYPNPTLASNSVGSAEISNGSIALADLSPTICAANQILKMNGAGTALTCAADDTGSADGHSLNASDGSPVDAVYVDGLGKVGIGTTSPSTTVDIRNTSGAASLKVQGTGASFTQANIVLQTHATDNQPEVRGLGIYAFNEGNDSTWYFGNPYNSPVDSFSVNRMAGATLQSSSADVANSLLIVRNDGKVGIGTTNPAATLEVAKAATGTSAQGNGGQMIIRNTDATAYNYVDILFRGTTNNDAAMISSRISDHTNSFGNLLFYTRGSGSMGTRMIISDNGNIGMGAAALGPTSRLEVAGPGTTSATSALKVMDSAGTPTFFVRDDGNVGVGTTSPAEKLTVNGDFLVDGTTTGAVKITANMLQQTYSTGNIYLAGGTSGGTIYLRTSGTDQVAVDAAGNVGIGMTGPTAKLHVTGQVAVAIPATMTPTGTTQTVNWNNGNTQTIDLGSATGTVVLTLSNPIAGATYSLIIVQGSPARAFTWPATVKWPGGTAPTLTATNDAIDMVTLFYNGTIYIASIGKDYR